MNSYEGKAGITTVWSMSQRFETMHSKCRYTLPFLSFITVEILAYCCTNNANRSLVSVRSTFSNCHVLFRYLHSFVQVGLSLHQAQLLHSEHAMPCVSSTDFKLYNQSCWYQLNRNCDQPTSTISLSLVVRIHCVAEKKHLRHYSSKFSKHFPKYY